MMSKKHVSFVMLTLFVIGLLGAGMATAAEYKEAPELAEMTAAGTLPPVEERLPENPIVVKAIESVGQYGGTWHRGWRGIKDFHCYGRLVYEPMLRWPRDPKDPPGLHGALQLPADTPRKREGPAVRF